MYKKSPQGWLKHWDFILLDIFCLQLAFVVAYLVRQGLENPYSDQIYRTVAFVFMLCQIVVMFLGQSYQDILKRGYYIEFTKTAKHVLMVMLLSVLYLFATQQAVSYSRLTLFYTAFLYLCFDYVGRVWHKENVLKKNATKKKEKSMVVVVSLAEAKETIEKILSSPIQNFSINGIALIDDNPGVKEIVGIPVVGNMDTISEYLCHEWVDEVFVKISETEPYPQKLIDEIITMGLTVHLSLGEMEKSLSGKNFIEKIGGYSVITSSINTASPKQLLYKRLMDIAGGIVGCLLTVILIVVIGPMIYIKSPGPIFFSQVRIGKNGKKFKIYKFRSMYMDAEERKVELMSQNKMEGLMFKMDYDPRIIGSEKKDKNGNPKGIGNFIRKTSLDEFPQFWNVLKGDMSLVGTRPPTVDEWEQYELHHRSRMSIKPGITGMWQASGRSDITDFEEVVKLDTEYIQKHRIKHPIVYIMACRIGPFAGHFYKEIHKLGGTVYLNPDGHEWMRAKWSAPIRKYWKISEQMMVKYCDLAICDSVNIEKYIHECYDGKGIKGRNPKTTFIAYGADLTLSKLADDDEKLVNWYKENGLTKKDYYLVVGRFVPENSFEVMIREFMKSKSKKNFAIITNVNEKFLNELEEKLHFKSDKRIKFVGTVYDQELLKKIRENAYVSRFGLMIIPARR